MVRACLRYTRRELRVHRVMEGGRESASLKTSWNKARERAGVPDLLLHHLRRTAVRNMISAGIPKKRAMLISGHRTRSVFDTYDIVDERDIQSDGEKLARYLADKAELSKVRTVASEGAARSVYSVRVNLEPPAGIEPATC